MQPNMPAPLTRDGGPVQGLPAIRLAGMKRNQPLAMMGGAASSVLLPGRTLNRHPRKADEATRRKWLQAKARRHCGDQKMTCHFPVHRRPVKGHVNQITHCLGRLFPVRVLAGGGLSAEVFSAFAIRRRMVPHSEGSRIGCKTEGLPVKPLK
jgi:hypothetical protein